LVYPWYTALNGAVKVKVLSVKVDAFTYAKFKERASREGLTVSELLRKIINESFEREEKENSSTSEILFILKEALRILEQAKTFCKEIPMPYDKQTQLKEFLEIQVRNFKRKIDYEKMLSTPS